MMAVHAVMYAYFFLTSIAAKRAAALRFAPVITALQISQFAWGTVINIFAGVAWATPSVGCAIHPTILQISAALYLAYGALFVRLFRDRYLLRPPPATPAASADAPAANPKGPLKASATFDLAEGAVGKAGSVFAV